MNAPANRFPFVTSAALLALFALAACSQGGDQSPASAAATPQNAQAEQAAEKLKLYQQMLDRHRDDLAAPIGEDIVNHFADTPAAAEVRKTLPGIEAKAKAQAEHDRLAALWSYQTGMQSGGKQISASITSSKPAGDAAVQMILRRHSKWGQSVYLFGSGHGFVCKGQCDVPMRFDGKPQKWKAYLPKTGEPALFIKDDARFIKAMTKAKVIGMDVDSADHGKEMLTFEVGGYDPAKFPELKSK
ncbi:MAG TPA: hypothetical protein VJ727_11255 [Rhodanobacteraceae bacterium]|nr:hypothetical protein [Rhodanobacteraceae bacterium]